MQIGEHLDHGGEGLRIGDLQQVLDDAWMPRLRAVQSEWEQKRCDHARLRTATSLC